MIAAPQTTRPTLAVKSATAKPLASVLARRCVCGRSTLGGPCAGCNGSAGRGTMSPAVHVVPAKPTEHPTARPADRRPVAVVAKPSTGAVALPPKRPTAATRSAKPAGGPAPAMNPPGHAPATDGKGKGKDAAKHAAPARDAGLKAVQKRVAAAATGQRAHGSAGGAAAMGQAAAVSPPGELQGQSAQAKVDHVDQQQAGEFSADAFKKALHAKIEALQPRTLEEATEYKDSGKAAAVKAEMGGDVASGQKGSAAAIAGAAAAPPDPGAARPKPVSPLPPVDAGPRPADVSPRQAAPAAVPPAAVDLSDGPKSVESLQASANITDATINKSNEPTFAAVLDTKKKAAQNAGSAPGALRHEEAAVIAQTQQQAAALTAPQLAAMHGTRGQHLGKVNADQQAAKARDEQARAAVSAEILTRFGVTESAVNARLLKLDEDAARAFDTGASDAQRTFEDYIDRAVSIFKAERYSGNPLLWIADKLSGPPEEINQIYRDGRTGFIHDMDTVIDNVARIVERGLKEAKKIVADGKAAIDVYVAGLAPSLREVGKTAAAEIAGKFEALQQSIVDKRDALVDTLAQKYVDAVQKVDNRIEEMKAADRGLIDAAIDAVKGLIETIKKLKELLLGVLARAADAIELVIADPIGFLGNLVAGVRLGFNNFVGKIGTYLQKGLLDWLFGALAESGITLPESFDLKGIFQLVMQVLGLTYANIRSRAVRIVGEKTVAALETAAGVFKTLITEGPIGLWNLIKEKIGDIKSMVIDQVKTFVMEKIITAGVMWVIGLLNPASAFIKACKAIYDVVMFFVERGSQILALVNAVIDSVSAIAKGAIGVAANMVEAALGKAIPVVIGFLASLLGLNGISDKIRKVIETVRAPINAAIDWVINGAVKLAKSVAGLFSSEKGGTSESDNDPQHDAKVATGMQQLDRLDSEYAKNGAITRKNAEAVAAKVKADNRVFKSVSVVEGKGTWDYRYVASPVATHTGPKQAPVSVSVGTISIDDKQDKKTLAETQASGTRALSPGKAYELAVRQLVVQKIIVPAWEAELGIPISVVASWMKEFKNESSVMAAVLKYEQTHRGEFRDPNRRPDATMELRDAAGNVTEVRVIEITLVEDFTESGEFAVHKAGQFFGTMNVFKSKYGQTVPIKFIFLAPKSLNQDTRNKVIEATIRQTGMTNVQVTWNQVG